MKNKSSAQNQEINARGRNTAFQHATPNRNSDNQRVQFQELRIGQFFESRGRLFQKIALSMARDGDGNGMIFQAQAEVLPDPFAGTAGTNHTHQKPSP
jgi:hypothetical protein